MKYLYYTLIYNPLFNALIFLYGTVAARDLGIAIVLLTLLIRIILFPVFHRAARHQALMQEIQPKIKKVQKDHKDDMEKQSRAMMELYREHKVNPFSGLGYLLIQLPILIALYQIFIHIFDPNAMERLYSFVSAPGPLNTFFLGLINLAKPSIVMVGLAALFQYAQAHMALPKQSEGEAPSESERMARRMTFIGPALTLAIFWNFPAAISLYWAASGAFSVIQQIFINRQLHYEKLERTRNGTGPKNGVQ